MNRSIFAPLSAVFFLVVGCASAAFAQDDAVWTPLGKTVVRDAAMFGRPLPSKYEAFQLDKGRLESLLARAPEENLNEGIIVSLPMADGSLQRFRVEHSLVVEPGLLTNFPELGATYRGYGIDDPTASVRFDLLPSGFHSIVLSANGTFLVDPAGDANGDTYVSYNKQDGVELGRFECLVKSPDVSQIRQFSTDKMRVFGTDLPAIDSVNTEPEVTSGTTLRTYRLALAADNEYCGAVDAGNTVAGCLAAEVLIMNRVNGIYERDVAIHMNIIANNDLITFATNKATGTNNICGSNGANQGQACTTLNDPYSNDDGEAMLDENQLALDARILTANYDIGHVFSTGGGGIADLGVPCQASFKASGVTGLTDPIGDAFAIDYVAHEMGHQFGADHTFNGTVSNCGGGNRATSAAYEPGSGITIMAYAGICGNQNLAAHSIDTFHLKSIDQIVTYTVGNSGNNCAVRTGTGNTPPTVSVIGGPSFTIPKQTPFSLSATGSDINGDTITYDWQEYDLGSSTTAVPNTDATNTRPIFRPYLPTTSGTRTFPALTYILNNANVPPPSFSCGLTTACLTGELLPQVGRTMTFQVIARDNRANGGGINTASASVVVNAATGPFVVTAPNTAVNLQGNAQSTVTWNVAGTTNSPVNAQNVDILFSSDGGQTFPTVLAAGTPNDGGEPVTVPNVNTSTARIKVQATGNIFFDISDANFSIVAAGTATISGKVLDSGGRSVTNAVVTLTFPNGSTTAVTVRRNGLYSFPGLLTGATYTLSVRATRFSYSPKVIPLTGDLANQDFTPL